MQDLIGKQLAEAHMATIALWSALASLLVAKGLVAKAEVVSLVEATRPGSQSVGPGDGKMTDAIFDAALKTVHQLP